MQQGVSFYSEQLKLVYVDVSKSLHRVSVLQTVTTRRKAQDHLLCNRALLTGRQYHACSCRKNWQLSKFTEFVVEVTLQFSINMYIMITPDTNTPYRLYLYFVII